MKNITLAVDEATLAASRAYAERHGTTLNQLVRDLLARAVNRDAAAGAEEMFRLMDEYPGDSQGWQWRRQDLYED